MPRYGDAASGLAIAVPIAWNVPTGGVSEDETSESTWPRASASVVIASLVIVLLAVIGTVGGYVGPFGRGTP